MRIWAIMLRILRQFRRDKRTLALLFIAPLIVLSLMNLVFNGSEYEPNIGVVSAPNILVDQMKQQQATVVNYESLEGAEQALDDRNIDAIVTFDGTSLQVKLEGSDPSVNKAVIRLLQKLGEGLQSDMSLGKIKITYLHGSENMTAIDQFGRF